MDASLARIEGRLDLLVQRAEHGDARAADHAAAIQRLDDRGDRFERDYITRAEMETKITDLREEMNRKFTQQAEAQAHKERQRLAAFAIVATLVGAAAGVIATLITT